MKAFSISWKFISSTKDASKKKEIFFDEGGGGGLHTLVKLDKDLNKIIKSIDLGDRVCCGIAVK